MRPHRGPRSHVQAQGRLVQEEHLGPMQHAAGDLEATLHAAGKAAHRPVGILGQAHALQGLAHAPPPIREAVETRLQVQVLAGGELAIQARLLEHHAQAAAHGGPLAHRVRTQDANAALRRQRQGRQDGDGSGLAGSVGSQQTEEGALLHAQIETVERGAIAVTLDQSRHLDGGHA